MTQETICDEASELDQTELLSEIGSTHLYRHWGEDGELLYVGISMSTLMRLSQHRADSEWFPEIAKVTIERFSTRAEALEAERKAIQTEGPRYNVIHKGPGNVRRRPKPPLHEATSIALARQMLIKPLYTTKEVSKVLSLSVATVARMLNDKHLGFVECGNRKYITGWQLIAFIEWWESVGTLPEPTRI